MNVNTSQLNKNMLFTLKLIWISFIFSQLIFFIISRISPINSGVALGPVVKNAITAIALIIAITVIFFKDKAALFFLKNASAEGQGKQNSEDHVIYMYFIIFFALSEAVGILGLASNLMFADVKRHLILGGISILCLIRVYPSNVFIESLKKNFNKKQSDTNIKVL